MNYLESRVMITIKSHDPLQPSYTYKVDPLAAYPDQFTPDLSPADLLRMGVFGNGYFEGHSRFLREFPHLGHYRLDKAEPDTNHFGVGASMPRREWAKRGWMHQDDPRGWFQWYCRFDMGRRHSDDERQIKRWIAFRKRKLRTIGGDMRLTSHLKTRQGLLHWGIASPGMAVYELNQ
jgi:hypothetical protein